MTMLGKRRRTSVVDLWHREVGRLNPRVFAHRAGASEDLILRLGIHKKLDKHRGCVNTVSFNADGDILVSGSDDRMIMLWDWDTGLTKLSFQSGHSNNVFQARFMPWTNDQTIVTCAADGEVRYAQIKEGGHVVTNMLAQHDGRAHKMAIEPGSSHIFYSCGEDGLVQRFDLRTKSATKLFTCKSFQDKLAYMPVIHLNAITIDPRNPNCFAIAGSDEYARVYDIRKYNWEGSKDFGYPTDCFCPAHLIGNQRLGITGLAFSDQSELLASYTDEHIYLFTRDQGVGTDPVMPSVEVLDANNGGDSRLVSASTSDAESNSRTGPQAYMGHENSDTVKGVSFFGPNCEYVVSGSDCGRIFIWRKKGGELLRVMEGDRHVVNCIEPHPFTTMIASCGIEPTIKIWTPNARKRSPPVKLEELKRKRKVRFCRLAVPEELARQILALQRRRQSSGEESSSAGSTDPDLLDIIMNYVDADDPSDDAEDPSDSPGDCVVS